MEKKEIETIISSPFTRKVKIPKIIIVKKDAFICEICHCVTPIECEGSEPNTCADCMPLRANNERSKYDRRD